VKRRNMVATLLSLPLAAGLLVAGCGNNQGAGSASTAGAGAGGGKEKLVVFWADWEPAKQLQTLVKEYPDAEVEVKTVPWSNYESDVKKVWTSQNGDAFDMVVGDSQWLGSGASGGHYVDLTDWAKTGIPMADIEEAAIKNYGEYPAGSGKLYAVPCESDCIGFAYRKDLFEDPKNKEAFKAKYGKDLAVPDTWEDFQKVAEFFTKPDGSLYGAALFYSKDYDGATMGFDQVLWAFGGKLSDGNGKVEGVLNDAAGVKALEFHAGLKKFCPPGAERYYFAECLGDFQKGKVAMAQSWFAFLPDLTNKEKNPHVDNTGYFMVPKGPAGRFISLGGQGISVSSYSKKQDAAKKFLEWFSKEETQAKWAKLGGLTANKKVAATEDYKKAAPYNELFSASMAFTKDFYNTPQYSELMKVSQENLNDAIAGAKAPKAALDAIAKAHQETLAAK